MRSRRLLAGLLLLAAAGCGGDGARAPGTEEPAGAPDAEIRAAVASNFAAPHAALVEAFTAEAGVRVRTSLGSTGGLFAQIRNGAPFDVFLAADRVRPRRLVRGGLAEAGSRFTYATGRLALFGPGIGVREGVSDALRERRIEHLALADPEAAPYGGAAVEALRRSGLYEELSDRIVRAESVGQVYQYVVSGAAEAGFVAASHVAGEPEDSYVLVDEALHAPIRQDAVLLTGADDREASRRFLAFLRSERAREILERFGYRMPPPGDGSSTTSPPGRRSRDAPSGGRRSRPPGSERP